MNKRARALLLFARDLRIGNNVAISLAADHSVELLEVYINFEGSAPHWAPGRASLEWLYSSLRALYIELQESGSALAVRTGYPATELAALARANGIYSVYTVLETYRSAHKAQQQVCTQLEEQGFAVHTASTNVLLPETRILTSQGRPYQKFAPFHKRMLPLVDAAAQVEKGQSYDDVRFTRRNSDEAGWEQLSAELDVPAVSKLTAHWQARERAARCRLKRFISTRMAGYKTVRNLIAADNVSQLIPHLHTGDIDIHAVYAASRESATSEPACSEGATSFQR